MLATQEEPLIVFSSERLEGLESRIAGAEQTIEGIQLENELREETIRALFGVPYWLYFAASEVPGQGISLEREQRLPYQRQDLFPAASLAGRGDVPGWTIHASGGDGATLQPSGASGEGSGILMEYIVQGDISNSHIAIPRDAAVAALYFTDHTDWQLSPARMWRVSTQELIGLIEEPSAPPEKGIPVSVVHIHDDSGMLGRYLITPTLGSNEMSLSWIPVPGTIAPGATSAGGQASEREKWPGITYTFVIAAFWLVFGIVVVLANLLYRFSDLPPLTLFVTSIALYLLFVAVSLLSWGFWGMGFVPAAAVGARFVSCEGRRLAAFGAILAASFIVTALAFLA
jgi:hypothetical protein